MESTIYAAIKITLFVLVILVCSFTDASEHNDYDDGYSNSRYFPNNYYRDSSKIYGYSSNQNNRYPAYANKNLDEAALEKKSERKRQSYNFKYNESDPVMRVFYDYHATDCYQKGSDAAFGDIVLSINPELVLFYAAGFNCLRSAGMGPRALGIVPPFSGFSSNVKTAHFFEPNDSNEIAELLLKYVKENCPEKKGAVASGLYKVISDGEDGLFHFAISSCLIKSFGFV